MADTYWKKSRIDFRNIFDTITDVYKISNSITKYIENLDKMYKNLLNYKTNDKNLLYFGLNTFYFQIRFLQSQYEDSKRQFVFLLNHLYADYYKLYKLIKYHVDSGSDEKLKKNLPTIPSTIKEELECNIFLRSITEENFSKLRDLKDNF
jgi:hypothetical protein